MEIVDIRRTPVRAALMVSSLVAIILLTDLGNKL